MKHFYFTILGLFLLTTCQIAMAGNLRITNVDPIANQVTIQNFDTATIDISTYRLKSNLVDSLISTLSVLTGNSVLTANATATYSMVLNDTLADLSLFCPSNTLDTTCLLDFMQWGNFGNARDSLAVAKGIWQANTFVSGKPPYLFNGIANSYGSTFWSIAPPLSDFGWSTNCQPDSVRFWSNGDTSKIVSYHWNFGDGITSTLQTPVHKYLTDTGFYTVKLIVMNTLQTLDSSFQTVNLTPCPPLSAFSQSGSCFPDSISFWSSGDTSKIISYNWDFGDGTTSLLQNPIHVFPSLGTYNVRLIVLNNMQIPDTTVLSLPLVQCPPLSDFVWLGNCFPDSIFFSSNTIPSKISSYNWNFGDGFTSTSRNQAHLYADTGTYTIRLIVTNNMQVPDTTIATLHLNQCPPLSDFSWNGGCSPDSVGFWSNSDPAKITSYNWDFGDGLMTSTTQTPYHTFADSGTYTVRLIVMNTMQIPDTTIHSVFIPKCPPLSNFYWNQTCYPDTVRFMPQGDSTKITSYLWNFGDSITSTLQKPIHTYIDSGNYNVTLIVIDNMGIADTSINNLNYFPCQQAASLSDFNYDGCGDTLWFHSLGWQLGTIDSWTWTFAHDSSMAFNQDVQHIFPDTGLYQVTLVVTSVGIPDTTIKMIHVTSTNCGGGNVSTQFSWNATCKGDSTKFTNTTIIDSTLGVVITSWFWDFGDGSTSTLTNPYHTYADTGSYTVKMVIADTIAPNTGSDSVMNVINIVNCPYAAFRWDFTCLGDSTAFTDSSTYANITSWNWDFGDGFVSSLQKPIHVYTAAGVYTVNLVIGDTMGILDTATEIVDIIDCSIPVSNITLTVSAVDATCNGGTSGNASVNAVGGLTPYTYTWSNGGTTNSINNLAVGTYFVSVMGADSALVSDSVIIGQPVSFNLTVSADTSICNGNTINLTVMGANTYSWSNGDSLAVISITPNITSVYMVNGTDVNGCTATDSVMITVFALPQTLISASQTTVCKNNKVTISASGATNYQWNNGLGVGDTINPTIINTISFIVDGISNNGCVASDTVIISMVDNPAPTITAIDAACGQAIGSASSVIIGGTAPYNYAWSNGSATTSLSNVLAGSYSLTVTDSNNCTGLAVAAISDQDGPSVSIVSSNNANCGGPDGNISIAITGGQAPLNYLWTNGSSTQNLNFIVAGAYGIEVTDANNCVGTAAIEILNLGANAPSISGYVKSAFNGFSINGGKILIFSEIGNGGAMESVASTSIDSTGFYNFPSVLPIGNYILMAIADTNIYPFTIPTYFGLTYKWDSASVVTAICDSAMTINLEVIDLVPLGGSSTLGGKITTDNQNKMGKFAGGPIPGVNVSLEQIPGGIVANTDTDVNGDYAFNNVPISDSSYTIYVDIPGLKMIQSYNVNLSTTDSTISNLNFLVGDTTVFVTPNTVSVEEPNFDNSSMKIYPNPYKGNTTIEYNLTSTKNIKLKIFNILGEVVYGKTINNQGIGVHKIPFSAKDMGYKSGIYFVNLTIGNKIITKRIIEIE